MLPQRADGGHVQIGGRLVQQIDLRLHGIDGGKGDLLLFSAGEGEYAAAQKRPDMQRICGLSHAALQLRLRDGFVFHPEGDLAVGIHIEKLRPGILEHAAHLFRDAVHGQAGKVFAIQQYLAAQFAGKELRDQAVDEPRQRGLAAAAAAAEQDALPVRDGETDIFQAALCAVGIGEGHVPEFDHAPTAFHAISAARNAANSAMTSQSAGRI